MTMLYARTEVTTRRLVRAVVAPCGCVYDGDDVVYHDAQSIHTSGAAPLDRCATHAALEASRARLHGESSAARDTYPWWLSSLHAVAEAVGAHVYDVRTTYPRPPGTIDGRPVRLREAVEALS